MMVGFGSWQPDTAGLDTKNQTGRALLSISRDGFPRPGGWMSNLFFAAVHKPPPVFRTSYGMFAARSSAGGWVIFAGSTTKLYKFNSGTSTWDDYSRISGGAYNVPVGDYWSWAQFGSKVLATNFNDNLQVIDIDTGAAAFADGAGSPPKARYVGIVGDFVFLACLNSNPRKVRNSAINDTTGWTIGTNLCDEQELPDGDNITGFSVGGFGLTWQHA